MPSSKRRSSASRALLLTLQYPNRASYYDDWRDAFCGSAEFDCTVVNILGLEPARLSRMIEDFDAIIMLHSCNSDTLDYFSAIAPFLGDRRRAKLAIFAGNEYNSPYVSMPDKVRLFRNSRADIVATQLLAEAGEFLYGENDYRVISIPHALNPDAFQPGKLDAQRRLDIGVKGYRYPAYLGDDDRNRIINCFQASADRLGLVVDISEDRRLSREQWGAFLGDCRGTISTETGTWYLEKDDSLILDIHAYLKSKRKGLVISNDGALRRLARFLPSSVKEVLWSRMRNGPVKFEPLDDFNTPFEELYERYFRDAVRPPVYGKAVSSRHFDAIGTRTCQIMFRGRFNDILVADQHYIALEHDLTNLDEAIARFKDQRERKQIVDRAYDHVMDAHTHAHRVSMLFHELFEAV